MSTTGSFNLLDEPWIVVLSRDGSDREVSVLDVFDHASDFTSIGGEVPTQTFAITRLLLAFLHRAVDGPATKDDWASLWSSQKMPMERITHYARQVHHRFNLFDPVAPFYQVAGLKTARDDTSSLERLVADVPNGEPLFTTRSGRNLRQIGAGEAARWLVHAHAFDPSGIKTGALGDPTVKGGRGYPIGPGWCGWLGGVLLHGADLHQTLMLNLIGRDAGNYAAVGGDDDIPAWEREPDGPSWSERPPRGAIDLYTWQTRRVRLVGDEHAVTGVVLANGDKITPQNRHTLEPLSAWQHSERQSRKYRSTVYMPLMHNPDRSVWRGIAALLPATAGRRAASGGQPQRHLAPAVLQWISDLTAQGVLADDTKPGVRVYGIEYGAQQATISELVEDQLPMPLQVLREDQPAAGKAAVEAVSDAECVAAEVWKLAERIAQAAGAEPKSGSGDSARHDFYALLDGPYRSWLNTINANTDLAEAREQWRQTVRRAGRAIADDVVAAAPPDAWTGREIRNRLINVALAEVWFTAGLNRCLPHTPHTPDTPRREGSE